MMKKRSCLDTKSRPQYAFDKDVRVLSRRPEKSDDQNILEGTRIGYEMMFADIMEGK